MMIVMTGFFLLLTVIIQLYIWIVKAKYGVQARQNLLQESYYTLEKLNVELKDFNIDYEEYFNRKRVGCDTNNIWSGFVWNVNSGNKNGYCDCFTHYGNTNSIKTRTNTSHKLYYCSSLSNYINPYELVVQNPLLQDGSGCVWDSAYFLIPTYQAFWQYAQQFIDVKNDVDFLVSAVGDNDDEDLWTWPSSIHDIENIQELYFISPDQTQRLFLRRSLIESWDRDDNGIISGADEKHYVIQILRLKGFDAWEKHDFDINNPWVYDWQIDTRACDFAQWFVCHGAEVDTVIYSWYRLPIDKDDGWVNLNDSNITLSDRKISIYPNKKADYAWAEDISQINPYIKISTTSKLYGQSRKRRLGHSSLDSFQVTLQTMFNTRWRYTK